MKRDSAHGFPDEFSRCYRFPAPLNRLCSRDSNKAFLWDRTQLRDLDKFAGKGKFGMWVCEAFAQSLSPKTVEVAR